MKDESKTFLGSVVLLALTLGIWRWLARRVGFLSGFSVSLGSASTFLTKPQDPSGALFASIWLTLISLISYLTGFLISLPFHSCKCSRWIPEACLLIFFHHELLRFHRIETRDKHIRFPHLLFCSLAAAALWNILIPADDT